MQNNQSPSTPVYVDRIKFYADTEKETNKYFCFQINSIFDLEKRILYWCRKVKIRAAWFETTKNGQCIYNKRINLSAFIDYSDQVAKNIVEESIASKAKKTSLPAENKSLIFSIKEQLEKMRCIEKSNVP